jgi:NAD(P)H-flavin reductase
LGFRCAPPVPAEWRPGTPLILRGPLGRGFSLPPSARRVALAAFDDSAARLRGLIHAALGQNAEVTLLVNSQADELPESVEVQPLEAAPEVFRWADYAALDVERGNLDRLKEMLGNGIRRRRGARRRFSSAHRCPAAHWRNAASARCASAADGR